MAIEDIKGYQPHSEEKINKVNKLKEAEQAFGLLLSEIETELTDLYSGGFNASEEELDKTFEAIHQIRLAKDRLKEACMWGCRAVFQPVESY